MVGNWLTFQGKSLTFYRKRPIFRISNPILLVTLCTVYIFLGFAWKHKSESGKRLFFIKQITTLENCNHETCIGHPFFYQKWGLKPKIFEILVGTKINVEWACFYIYLYHINHPMENGNNETCISLHLFSRKLRVKTTPYRIMYCSR